MAAQELTATNFEELTGGGIALVDFWAEWCGPCHRFSPVFEDVAEKHQDDGVVFGKIDIDAQPELAQRFGVQSIPTLMVVRDGVILYQQPGGIPAPYIESLIEQAQQLDMDEVRKTAESSAS
jgi:thioredoxin 1